MATDIDHDDLRILSLLHALGDREELIREAIRLLLESSISESGWAKVRHMGAEIAPNNLLFNTNKTLEQIRCEFEGLNKGGICRTSFDRRQADRRLSQRRLVSDRRLDERRLTSLPWLVKERRGSERRLSMHRQTELGN